MTELFKVFLLTSVIGTMLAILLAVVRPITKKCFSAGWHYYMWLAVLVVMLLPVRLQVPKVSEAVERIQISSEQTVKEKTPGVIATQIQPSSEKTKAAAVPPIRQFAKQLAYIWLYGAIMLLLYKGVHYIVFRIYVHKRTTKIFCPQIEQYTKRRVHVRAGEAISSPILIGVCKPVLLLPHTSLADSRLHNVLAHELTHLKRNDLLYKWVVCLVKCLHWFNPAMYIIGRQIDADCEISCDVAVTGEMDNRQKKEYAETILLLLKRGASNTYPLATGMAGSKKLLKKRFANIKQGVKPHKAVAVLSGCLAVLVLGTTVLASGVMQAAFVTTPSVVTVQPIADTYTENAVVMPDSTKQTLVPEPLNPSDMMHAAGIQNVQEISTPVQDVKIKSEKPSEYAHIVLSQLTLQSDVRINTIEQSLQQRGVLETSEKKVDLNTRYKQGQFVLNESVTAYSDGNGNITFYFAQTTNDYVDIAFTDSETGNVVAEYGVMPNLSKAYSFTGFEAGKTYNIQLQAQTKENINYMMY